MKSINVGIIEILLMVSGCVTIGIGICVLALGADAGYVAVAGGVPSIALAAWRISRAERCVA